MPSQTTHGYPYPLGTDRVMDGDDSIHALADAVESKLRASAAGVAACPVNNSVSGNVTVTFPVGRFPAGTTVVAQGTCASHAGYYAVISVVSNTSLTMIGQQRDNVVGTTAALTMHWFATTAG